MKQQNDKPTASCGQVIPVRGFMPQIGSDAYLAPGSIVIGDVVMGDGCSVWFNAVVRGDVNSIRIGNHVNIQDGSVLHTTYKETTIQIGNNVSIGHNVILHGAKVDDYALIGMGSIVMDNAHIGTGAIVAAGAVVLEGTVVPPHTIYAGVPAKQVKVVDPEQSQAVNHRIANGYGTYARWFTHPEEFENQ